MSGISVMEEFQSVGLLDSSRQDEESAQNDDCPLYRGRGMNEPTEREWLEGLRPEDEREFYNRAPRPDHSDVVGALDWWVSWHGDAESVSIPDIATLASAARVYAHDTESDARRTEEER